MTARRILIVVPNLLRDLDGHALLGYHLVTRYGHDVVYSDGRRLEDELIEVAPDVVVLDHLSWDYRAVQARLVKRLGMRLALLPTSGLFQEQDSQAHEQIAGKLTGTSNLVDCYFVWGEQVRDILLAARLLPAERIHVVGSPRFDFYSPPYLDLAATRLELARRLGISNPEAPIILWTPNNTSIATGDPRADAQLAARWAAATNGSPEDVLAEMADVRTQYEEHSRVVLELARRHPEWNFVVKVHPSDRPSSYFAMASECPNIRVVHDVPILDLLLHSTVLLQRYSTTANEAAMLGRPSILLEIGEYRIGLTERFVAGNQVARDVDEVEALIRHYAGGGTIGEDQRRQRDAFLREVFYRIDGMAGERCAALLNELVAPPGYTDADQREMRARVEAYRRRRRLDRLAGYADPRAAIRALREKAWRLRRRWQRRGEASREQTLRLTRNLIASRYARFDSLRKSNAGDDEAVPQLASARSTDW